MNAIVLAIICLLLPPLAVFLHSGLNRDFWINLVLTLLGFIPGLLHGLYVIFAK